MPFKFIEVLCPNTLGLICRQYFLKKEKKILIHDTKPTKCTSTALTLVKYIDCFQDTGYQGPSDLYHYSTKKCLHFNHLSVSCHVSFV